MLTGNQILGFSNAVLTGYYDDKKPTPPCHLEWWDLCGSDHPQIAVAAPRNHAKSTAITHCLTLAATAFRMWQYVIIVSDTEEQAVEFLTDIRNEIKDNEILQDIIQFKRMVKDATTDAIVECVDGHQFRILAKGAEQKLRGRKWRGRRPDAIVCDDLENDEIVENSDRREKFRRWFFAACKQSLRDGGVIRVVGTILHEDSLLSRLIKNKTWTSRLYKAHAGFDDFSQILWKEKFPEARLRNIRQEFIEEGTPELYSQEYLNDPFDSTGNYFQRSDFIPLNRDDPGPFIYYAGVDFAISERERSDRTAFKVVRVNPSGRKAVIYSMKDRWDSLQIIEQFFDVEALYAPECFFVESDKIEKAIGPVLEQEMRLRKTYLAIEKITPSKSKRTRATPLRKEMRGRNVEWDMDADWFHDCQQEFLRFDKGVHDDDVDSTGVIFLGLNDIDDAPTHDELAEDDYDEEFGMMIRTGRDIVCGY